MELDRACIQTIFEKYAYITPDKIAIRYSDKAITYCQLNTRANYLANHLMSMGARRGDVIALALTRSFEMFVSMLAILKCGACYLPLDETNPQSRSNEILKRAEVKILITDKLFSKSWSLDLKVITTKDTALFLSNLKNFESVPSGPEDKAYLMFTSGSSGKPKGVVVPHRAVVRLVKNTNYICVSPNDKVLQFAPFSFDASTFEIWGALLNGATLVLYSNSVLDPNVLKKDIRDNQVSVLWLTAALFHLIVNRAVEALRNVRVLLAGGDVLNPKYVNKVLEECPGITVINGYGPTENTTFTCCHRMTIENGPGLTVPIGMAVNGTQIHILNDSLKTVKVGEIGELFVSGDGVALGYLNEEQSRDTFFINEDIAFGLIYRTGDLVRESTDGVIEFIGRIDNQVKIRGYRVSLEEVKISITELDPIRDAAVTQQKYQSGDQLLVAYIEFHDGDNVEAKEIKNELSKKIPKYMIPDKFVFVEKLPVTDNGKINSKLLKSMG